MIGTSIRIALRQVPSMASRVSVRTLRVSAVRNADLISDLYLKEIKGFKPAALTAADAAEHVKPWAAPSAPAIPAVEGDIATELPEYEAQAVEVEGVSADAADAAVEDWFVVEEPHDDAHH